MKLYALILILLFTASAASQWTLKPGTSTKPGMWTANTGLNIPPLPPPNEGYWTGILDPTRATDYTKVGVIPLPGFPTSTGGIPYFSDICARVLPTGIHGWEANHVYAPGSVIADAIGNTQVTVAGGTSGRFIPNPRTLWPTTVGPTFTETTGGTGVTWQLKDINGADAGKIKEAVSSPACLQASPATPKVVQLEAGSYYLTRGINLNVNFGSVPSANYIVLRGRGPDQTKLYMWGLYRDYQSPNDPVAGPGTGGSAISELGCSAGQVCAYGNPQSSILYSGPGGAMRQGGAAVWKGTVAEGVYRKGDTRIITGPWRDGQSGTLQDTRKPQVGMLIMLDQVNDEIGLCPLDMVPTISGSPNPNYGQPNGTDACAPGGTPIWGATEAGTTITLHTSLPHGYHVGQCVMTGRITNANNSNVNDQKDAVRAFQYNSIRQRLTMFPNQCAGFTDVAGFFVVKAVPNPTTLEFDAPLDNTGTAANNPNYGQPVTGLAPAGNGVVGAETGGINMGSIVQGWLAEGDMSIARVCPDAAYYINPSCLPGEVSGRAQTEVHILKARITDSCPAGDDCWELDSPINFPNWRSSQRPGAYFFNLQAEYEGFEDFSVDSTKDGIVAITAGHQGIIKLVTCVNCWVKNTRVIRTPRAAVWMVNNGVHLTIADNYLYYSKSATSTSYTLEATSGVTDSLIINNICQSGSVCLISNIANGNVWAYNYMVASNNANPVGTQTPMLIANHENGHYSLFEGNNSAGSAQDNIHGPSTANTFFRGRMRGQDYPLKAQNFWPGVIRPINRATSYVGSVLGGAFTRTLINLPNYYWTYNDLIITRGYMPPMGVLGGPSVDQISVASLMRWGNYDAITSTARWEASEVPNNNAMVGINPNPVPANHTLPPSFWTPTRPLFFTTPWGTPGWPPIGPDVDASAGTGGGTPSLDATCPITAVSGVGSWHTCDGIEHKSYQIPAQACFARTPVDPEYEQTFTVTHAEYIGASPFPPWAGSSRPLGSNFITLTTVNNDFGNFSCGGSACNKVGDAPTPITVSGIVPDGYNGVFQLIWASPTSISYMGSPFVGNPGPYQHGGQVTWPNIRLFNARNCYPQDFPTTVTEPVKTKVK